MHTDSTLELLDELTKQLVSLIRKFAADTSEIPTLELHKEVEACKRQQNTDPTPTNAHMSTPVASQKAKKLNLTTYKFHAIGDYPQAIRFFRTIDSTSTQRVGFPSYILAMKQLI